MTTMTNSGLAFTCQKYIEDTIDIDIEIDKYYIDHVGSRAGYCIRLWQYSWNTFFLVDPCSEEFAVVGPCKALIPSWSYNQRTGKCEYFEYGGCKGNNNRFREGCKNKKV